jgi:hypothetical protein
LFTFFFIPIDATAGWDCVPADVGTFASLPLMTVVTLSLVSRRCRKLMINPTKSIDKTAVLASLYSGGASVELLEWFQQHLQCPIFKNIGSNHWVALAAAGYQDKQHNVWVSH